MNTLDRIIAFETGTLSEDEIITLFQELVDSGLAWSLQGSYGRTAHALIDAGLVKGPIPGAHIHKYGARTL